MENEISPNFAAPVACLVRLFRNPALSHYLVDKWLPETTARLLARTSRRALASSGGGCTWTNVSRPLAGSKCQPSTATGSQ